MNPGICKPAIAARQIKALASIICRAARRAAISLNDLDVSAASRRQVTNWGGLPRIDNNFPDAVIGVVLNNCNLTPVKRSSEMETGPLRASRH